MEEEIYTYKTNTLLRSVRVCVRKYIHTRKQKLYKKIGKEYFQEVRHRQQKIKIVVVIEPYNENNSILMCDFNLQNTAREKKIK